MQLRIPKPCGEDWNQMTPEATGRHCASCCKVVVDFTDWEPEAISNYLKGRAGEKTCGRFKVSQLEGARPVPEEVLPIIARAPMPWLYRMAAVFLLAFGIAAGSCGTDAPGTTDSTDSIQNTPKAGPLVGAIAPVPDTSGTTGIGAGSTCVPATLGEPMIVGETIDETVQFSDTPAHIPQVIMGGIAPYRPPVKDTIKVVPKKTSTQKTTASATLKGDVALVREEE